MLHPRIAHPQTGIARWTFPLVAMALLLALTALPRFGPPPQVGTGPSPAARAEPGAAAEARAEEAYGELPLSFEENLGQADSEVRFISRGSGYTLFLTPTEAVLSLSKSDRETDGATRGRATPGAALRMGLVGANPRPRVSGTEQLPGKVNYLRGRDPSEWRTDVPTYAGVGYEGVYPGIDMLYYGEQGQLEYDFVLAPGADPDAILLRFGGADGMEIDDKGDLVLRIGGGEVRQRRPYAYQEVGGGRREVASRYALVGGDRVGFELGEYDASRPLVIDPVLAYSTYLGGGGPDGASDIAVDARGNAYVTGGTGSADFPTTEGAFVRTRNGDENSRDAFVAKLDAAGSSLLYSTYLGGGGSDLAESIAVDAAGNAYVAGSTASADFPTTSGAFQTLCQGTPCSSTFATKLDAGGGTLAYSTFLAPQYYGGVRGVAVDADGNAYLTGSTASSEFPTTPGAFDTTYNGGKCVLSYDFPSHPCTDAVVMKLNAAGSALLYSTYLGGADDDYGSAIAVDADGDAFVTGGTGSEDFPTTATAFDRSYNGGRCFWSGHVSYSWSCQDAFVTGLDAAGSRLLSSTYLGGSGVEYGENATGDFGAGIALDASGSVYVAGFTESPDFPTTPGAHDRAFAAGRCGSEQYGPPPCSDAFAAKLHGTLSGLLYSTFVGGSGNDSARDIAVDPAGNAHLTGSTESVDFPTTRSAPDRTLTGRCSEGSCPTDAFVTKLSVTASSILYSTYLGGAGGENASGIALGPVASAYVTGGTDSTDFPTTPSAWDTTLNASANSGSDGFVTKIVLDTVPPTARAPVQRLVARTRLGAVAVPVRLSWSARDNSGRIDRYQLQVSRDGGRYLDVRLPSPTSTGATHGLLPGRGYRYRVHALDAEGNWSGWAYGPRFTVTAHQETSRAVSYRPKASWKRAALKRAYGGYVRHAKVSGAKARIAFTGRGVAWVSTKSANRGKAGVWLDGKRAATVDLYARGLQLRRIVFARSWTRPGRHSLEVRVLGKKHGSSTGTRVDVDAFVVLR